jgi:hypothetical protein
MTGQDYPRALRNQLNEYWKISNDFSLFTVTGVRSHKKKKWTEKAVEGGQKKLNR